MVPAIVRYEVGRYTLTQVDESAMDLALRALSRFEFIPMDETLTDSAARLAQRHKFSMADAFVYATSQFLQGELWTQDSHFATLPGVKYFRK